MFGKKKKNQKNNQSPIIKDKTKKIDLDTLEMKSKKKKTIIIASVFGLFIIIAFAAIINTFLSIDRKKVYKERKKISLHKELEVIQNPEYKENWAISVENKLSEQDKKISKINKNLETLKEDILTSIKTALNENNIKINKKIDKMSQNMQEKVNEVKDSFNSEINKINKRMEQLQLEITVVKNAQEKQNNSSNNNLIVGQDLLPLKEKPAVKNEKEGDLTIIVQKEEKKEVEKAEKKIAEKKDTSLKIDEKNELLKNQKKIKPVKETKPQIVKSLKKNIKVEDIDTSFNAKVIQNINQIQQEEAQKKAEEKPTWHVSVGFAKAYMITGAYAPTFQNANSEPLPVLLEADGNILMANNVEGSVEKCFLLGSAKGNMNSQTVNIKLVSINCLLEGGKYRIEGPISGWVIGENGVPGIHGELLHKNGAWIARTFVAGFLQTFSQAVSGTQVQPIVVGGTDSSNQQSTNTGQAITTNIAAAAGQGISNVFGKLGDYYLKMAEQIFPVIEVKPGRTVSIMLMGGEDLTLVKNNPVDIRQMEEYIENQFAREKAAEESKKISGNAFTRTIMQEGTGKDSGVISNENANNAEKNTNNVKYINVNGKRIKVPNGN